MVTYCVCRKRISKLSLLHSTFLQSSKYWAQRLIVFIRYCRASSRHSLFLKNNLDLSKNVCGKMKNLRMQTSKRQYMLFKITYFISLYLSYFIIFHSSEERPHKQQVLCKKSVQQILESTSECTIWLFSSPRFSIEISNILMEFWHPFFRYLHCDSNHFLSRTEFQSFCFQ